MSIFSYPDPIVNYNYGTITSAPNESSDDYGLGFVTASVTDFIDNGLLNIPTNTFGTVLLSSSSTPKLNSSYNTNSINLLETPYDNGIVSTIVYQDYGKLSDTVSYLDYGALTDPLNPGLYTENGATLLPVDTYEDYEFVTQVTTVNPENYGFIYINETLYPYGTVSISGSSSVQKGLLVQYAGSGILSAIGGAAEVITDSYNKDSIYFEPASSVDNYGLTIDAATEFDDYELITSTVDTFIEFGLVSNPIPPYGTSRFTGTAQERFIPASYVGSGSVVESIGTKIESSVESYNIDSILYGAAPDDYGTVNTSATVIDNFGTITIPVTEAFDYRYIYNAAGVNVYPYGTIQVSGISSTLIIQVGTQFGSGTLSAIGGAAEVYGPNPPEDIVLFTVTGTAQERFIPASYVGSGSVVESIATKIESSVESYNIDSILYGSPSDDYGTVNTSPTVIDNFGTVLVPVTEAFDYRYIYNAAGVNVYPYGTISLSGSSFNELRIQFIQTGSGTLSAIGGAAEVITDSYNKDSVYFEPASSVDNYGLITVTADQTDDYGLITASVDTFIEFGLVSNPIPPYGNSKFTGTAAERFIPAPYVGSGSVVESIGTKIEKNTESYNTDSILYGAVPDDYGTVNTSATITDNFGTITVPVTEAFDYRYIFNAAGVDLYPFGTVGISGSSFNELRIQFIQFGSGTFSIFGGAADVYGSNPPEDTVLFSITGTAQERFIPSFNGSGTINESIGTKIEKNTESYNTDSILYGSPPDDYGTVNTSATITDNFGTITVPVTEAFDYRYIYNAAGVDLYPFGTVGISGSAFSELRIQFIQTGSGTLSAIGGAAEVVVDSYNKDSIYFESATSFDSYGLVIDAVTESDNYGLIASIADTFIEFGLVSNPIPPYGTSRFTGTAQERFIPAPYVGSGTINESIGTKIEKNTESYNTDSILYGAVPDDYGTVNTSATVIDNFGTITIPVTEAFDYRYIFNAAGVDLYPFGTIQVSGSSFNELRIQFIQFGSGTFSIFGGAADVYGPNPPENIVLFSITGTAQERFIPSFSGFGSFSAFGGAAEVYAPNPPENTVLFSITGTAQERFIPTSYVGSGTLSAIGGAAEVITDSYNNDSVYFEPATSFDSYGLVTVSADQTDDYGLIIATADTFIEFGLVSNPIPPYGISKFTGTAQERFIPSFSGSGSVAESIGTKIEKNTESYNTDSILYGSAPDDYGTVNTSATVIDNFGTITIPVTEAFDYRYIFNAAGTDVYPFGTVGISGSAFSELRIQFIQFGSGTLSAIGGAAEVITDSYNNDSVYFEPATSFDSYGLVIDAVTESDDYGLIIATADTFIEFGLVSNPIPPYGISKFTGTAQERFIPAPYVGSGTINESIGTKIESSVESYNTDSILYGAVPDDYGTVNASATVIDNFGTIMVPVTKAFDYRYIFNAAGVDLYPFGIIGISGSAFSELRIQFIQFGSGTFSIFGGAAEVSGPNPPEDTVLFSITGTAQERFIPSFSGSGTINESIGTKIEKNTESYNTDSILYGSPPDDYGTVNTSATVIDNFGTITVPVTEAFDYRYIYNAAGVDLYPFGTIGISGSAFSELRIQFIQTGSGTLSVIGGAAEVIADSYNKDSIYFESATSFDSYGLITASVDQTDDYGLITSIVDTFIEFGLVSNPISPYGVSRFTGTAQERFIPAPYIGSGSINESISTKIEKNTESYNTDSILYGAVPDDYGTVNTSATTTDNFGTITVPVTEAFDYRYIFNAAGVDLYPFGTISISGTVKERFIPTSYVGSGTINISGYVNIPQYYYGSGSLSVLGGAAEVYGPKSENTVLFTFSGGYSNLQFAYGNAGSGTIQISGNGDTSVQGKPLWTGGGTIEISGTVRDSFTPTTYIASGTANISGSATESFVPATAIGSGSFAYSGTKIEKDTNSYYPFGSITLSGNVAGKNVNSYAGSGTIQVSGTVADSFTPKTYIASGSLSVLGGSAEVYGPNPPENTVLFTFSGGYSNLQFAYGNAGSGTIQINGNGDTIVQGKPLWVGSGTIEISGTVRDSFTPTTYIASGTANISGSARESFVPATAIGSGNITISGAATNLKSTESYAGSGTISVLKGAAEVYGPNPPENIVLFSITGTARESFVPATAIGSGSFAYSGTKIEKDTNSYNINSVSTVAPYGTITISGAATNLKNINSVVGFGTATLSGSSTNKSIHSEVGSGTISIGSSANLKRINSYVGSGSLSALGGSAEVYGPNPPENTVLFSITGTARESFTPRGYTGIGSFAISGNSTSKSIHSEVGFGTVSITGSITPNVQIYVPKFTGSGTISVLKGAAEIYGPNPPENIVLFSITGTARESFTPKGYIGIGSFAISGTGIGVSNPYRKGYVYVTII